MGFSTTITSPGYPSNYGNNLECYWRIQAGSFLSGYIVKVTFNDFQVGGGSLGICFRDELKFYDGDSKFSNPLGSYCGTVNPEVIYSSGHYLYVKFLSGYGSYKGFSFNVAAVAKGNHSLLFFAVHCILSLHSVFVHSVKVESEEILGIKNSYVINWP